MAKKRDTKALLLAAAEKLFKNKRYHELTLDDVARMAAVGKGTIYLYFKNKEDLVCQLATHGHDELCSEISSCVENEKLPLRELLIKIFEAVSSFYNGRHTLFRIMEQEAPLESLRDKFRQEIRKRRFRLVSLIAGLLGREDNLRQLRKDIDLEALANFFLGMVRARNHNFSDDPALMPSPELVVSIFLEGAARTKLSSGTFQKKKPGTCKKRESSPRSQSV